MPLGQPQDHDHQTLVSMRLKTVKTLPCRVLCAAVTGEGSFRRYWRTVPNL